MFKIYWSDFGSFKLAKIGSDPFQSHHLIFLDVQSPAFPLLQHLLAPRNEFQLLFKDLFVANFHNKRCGIFVFNAALK